MDDSIPLWFMAANEELRSRWHRWLSTEGWSVTEISARAELPKVSRSGQTGPALLDASLLNDGDIAALREKTLGRISVILFGQGSQASDASIVHWLQAGADDFVPSSIQEKVLMAKLAAHARRLRPDKLEEQNVLWSPSRKLKADQIKRLAWIKGENGRWRAVPGLTETEHALLCLFLAHPDAPLERGLILDTVWGERAGDVNPETLTKHIESLRKKLGPPHDESIRTVYGKGYLFMETK